jgi:hypothetical protein
MTPFAPRSNVGIPKNKWCSKLDKPTKVLFAGILVGVLVYGFGQMYAHRLERRIQELQRACVAESQAETKEHGALSALTSIFAAKPSCDPVELARSDEHTGIQGQLAAAELDALSWAHWPLIASMTILLGCCLPWLWYFFLRRIRELREAIIGK